MLARFTYLVGPRKGESLKFDAQKISIGRAPDNLLAFDDGERRVSSHHAEIVLKNDHFILRDLGSTNGTMINGRRVVTSEIKHDDMIEFGAGGPLLRFQIERADVQAQAGVESPPVERGLNRSASSGVKRAARAHNTSLIAAIVAAMIVGAIGGVLLSRSAASETTERGFAKIAERNRSAVVFIRAEFELVDANNRVAATEARTGSGFIVSSAGLIVTNRHLIRDWEYNAPPPGLTGRAGRIEVVLPGRRVEEAIPAREVKAGEQSEPDVAVLKIDPPFALPVVQGLETNLAETNQGDEVAVIGYPLGMDLLQQTNAERIESSLSAGVVSRVNQDFIQLYLSAYRGNSGGPVFNRRGQVIGILTANVGGAQDIALCTPIKAAFELIKEDLSYRARARN